MVYYSAFRYNCPVLTRIGKQAISIKIMPSSKYVVVGVKNGTLVELIILTLLPLKYLLPRWVVLATHGKRAYNAYIMLSK